MKKTMKWKNDRIYQRNKPGLIYYRQHAFEKFKVGIKTTQKE